MKKVSLLLEAICISLHLNSQSTETTTPILFIYDASGSMWGQIEGKAKIEIASTVLTTTVNKLPADQKIGIVAYGHRKKGDCQDVEFLVDFEGGTKSSVIQAVEQIKPLGKTPLAFSALQVIDKLRQIKEKATIILITDGIESCDGNLCEVIKAAKKEGIEFRFHIIGFGLKDANTEQLSCAAVAGDGIYYDADNAESLSEVLDIATNTRLEKPVENYSVFAIKNGIAIDAWVKVYDNSSKDEPIAVRTYKDTAFFYLPEGVYDFEVLPLGGSDV